ncbi:MAG: hypothetical protein LBV51_05680 [Acholeplasmatales bacterium]|jgi:hypothetical protein|nr:hypothetical protein [Acholeplasmatales bacterium]
MKKKQIQAITLSSVYISLLLLSIILFFVVGLWQEKSLLWIFIISYLVTPIIIVWITKEYIKKDKILYDLLYLLFYTFIIGFTTFTIFACLSAAGVLHG